jgi:hypothetical protein
VANLDRHYVELRRAAAARLGALYNPSDYPETLIGLFGVAWDYPNVEPPEYLVRLSPSLYQQEQERVRARFDEAVRLAERAFAEEFARLVQHLAERITGTGDDGSPKVFRDSAVGNLADFFGRFRELNVRSNPQLDELVERAQAAVRGVGAQDLRDGRGPSPSGLAAALAGPDGPRRDAGRATAAAHPPPGRLDAGGELMHLVIAPGGRVRAIYSEEIDLASLGHPEISRASHVEPDGRGGWTADLGPVGGPVLGPFALRSEALAAELAWLEARWLGPTVDLPSVRHPDA